MKRIALYVAGGLLSVVVVLTIGVVMVTNHGYVTTPSMYPTIPPGSMVFIHKDTDLHAGQVIEFHGYGLDYVHRIIRIEPNGDIITKGDNPENAPDVFDPPITARDVIGVVYRAPRYVGFPELILNHPSYGMSWLRAELGTAGKLMLIGIVTVLTGLVVWLFMRPETKKEDVIVIPDGERYGYRKDSQSVSL